MAWLVDGLLLCFSRYELELLHQQCGRVPAYRQCHATFVFV